MEVVTSPRAPVIFLNILSLRFKNRDLMSELGSGSTILADRSINVEMQELAKVIPTIQFGILEFRAIVFPFRVAKPK